MGGDGIREGGRVPQAEAWGVGARGRAVLGRATLASRLATCKAPSQASQRTPSQQWPRFASSLLVALRVLEVYAVQEQAPLSGGVCFATGHLSRTTHSCATAMFFDIDPSWHPQALLSTPSRPLVRFATAPCASCYRERHACSLSPLGALRASCMRELVCTSVHCTTTRAAPTLRLRECTALSGQFRPKGMTEGDDGVEQ